MSSKDRKRGAENRTPDSLSNPEGLEVDLRAEQNVGGTGVAANAGVASLIRESGTDPADRAAERHARAVGVDHTRSPARRIQLAVADTAANSGIAQTFVVVQVRSAELERTGRPVDAGNPGAVLAVMTKGAVVGRVDDAEAQLLPGDLGADVPLMEGIVLVKSIGSRVLNVGVATAQRHADFLPLAFIPQRAFPGIAEGADPVLQGNAKGRRSFVAARLTADRQRPAHA